ncbi:MAG: LPS-assembly protein LptD [Pseudolabrys sp.]
MAELPTARPSASSGRSRGAVLIAALIALALGGFFGAVPANAQVLTFPSTPAPVTRATLPKQGGKDQMLVQARQIDYDYNNHRVAAVGNVQIYYGGSTLEADKVIYDENTKRLRAEGNARLTQSDGNVTYGEVMDLSDDYRDGFVDSLHLETAQRTRIAAARANRTGGNFTVFDSGVYTACLPCKDDPKRPPLWQVKAERIIHDQGEKMMYFEQSQIEFFGTPVLYLPYFSAPDPTVKRKSGFLMPQPGYSTIYGASIGIPYYWALAPDYDMTFLPVITSKQGVLAQGEFRQRLLNGAYAIRATGIYQLDKNYFGPDTPGNRDFRGSIESTGQFALNDKWVWGWDGIALTDRSYLQDYRPSLSSYRAGNDPTNLGLPGINEAISQAYISGKGSRSYFDARTIYYYGFSSADAQGQLPFIRPVIDYDYTFDRPIAGGELGLKMNFVSLSRNTADFDAFTAAATASGQCAQTADPLLRTSANCLLRGVPGDYTRFSAQSTWRRSITDPFGQVFTPFASLRVDTAALSVRDQPGVSNYLPTGDSQLVRAMPTVGLEYRYPFINVQPWGTQTFEPIAQVIARPNEPQIGRWPNEDAQSLTFDDSNLFKVDKFSGWDRVEGGGRANAGAQYTAQFNQGGSVSALFGQSYQLFGDNSFGSPGLTNTGLDSGLDTARSDYVARFTFAPNRTYNFTSRFRFDKDTFERQRMELQASANFNRWTVSALYGDYAAQPDIGFLYRRQGVLGSVRYKLDANWVLFASALYDLNAHKVNQTTFGAGYIDDCFILALNYSTYYSYDVTGLTSPRLVNAVMLQIGLRTLGGSTLTTNVSDLAAAR